MPEHSPRTADAARDSLALREALARNDAAGAQVIIDHCDPVPTVFCLASAWLRPVEHQGLNAGQILADMQRFMPEQNGRTP
jgi:hypothetical protein